MKYFKILLIFYFLPQLVNSQNTFQKLIGGNYYDVGNCVSQTFDGGFIICGSTEGFDSTFSQMHNCLIKTDSLGILEWSKVFVTGQFEIIYSVQQTIDSGYIAIGYTHISSVSQSDILVIKTDEVGNPEWVKSIGNNNEQIGFAILQTDDHGYVLCGGDNANSGNSEADIVRLDSTGNIMWSKKYGNHVAQEIVLADNGDFVISGKTSNDYLFVMRIDSAGNLVWNKRYLGLGNPKSSLVKTSDNGFGLLGTSLAPLGGYTDFCFSKLDSAGSVLWAKIYGGFFDEYGYSAIQTSDGGFMLGGNSQSLGASVNRGCVIKIDSSGIMQWVKSVGGFDNEEIYSIDENNDHGFILCGVSNSFGSGNWDIYLVKTDSMGKSGCNDSAVTQFTTLLLADTALPFTQTAVSNYIATDISIFVSSGGIETSICSTIDVQSNMDSDILSVFPNPASGKLFVDLSQINESGKLEIINSLGETFLNIKAECNKLNEIDISNFSAGVYFLKLIFRRDILSKKIIVQ